MSATEFEALHQALKALEKKVDGIATTAAFMPPLAATPKLNSALAKAQGEFPPIPKTKEVVVKNGDRILYKFYYADLADIIRLTAPALSKNGLSHSCTVEENPKGGLRLVYFLRHESGEETSSSLPVNSRGDRPQDLGGVLTFYKRYLLSGLLGVASDDDTDSAGTAGGDVEHGARDQGGNGKGPAKTAADAKKQAEAAGKKAGKAPAKEETKAPAGRSKEEAKRLNEAMTKHEWSPEQGKEFIKAAYGVDSSAKLTKDQFEEFLNVIEKMKPAQAIEIAQAESGGNP